MPTNPTTIIHPTRSREQSAISTVRLTGTVLAAILSIGFLVSGCNSDTPTEGSSPSASVADTAGVTGIATAWDAAWNAGDPVAIAALFVDDAEFINGRGQIAQGAAMIQANHTASLGGVFKGSHTQGSIRNIVFMSSTSAVLDVENKLTGYSALPPGTVETSPGVQRGHHKRVVVKRNGAWRILQMQITNIAPPR